MWDPETYLNAWNFASSIHLGQTIPGSQISYINHLGLVAMEACTAIVKDPAGIADPDLLIQCALLHDAIEDTSTTFEDIQQKFGTQVANGVLALSKDLTLPTKREQILDSLSRIKMQPQAVWMVKLCDRITNLQPPPHYWNNEKILAYKDEARVILEHLGEASSYLAQRLKSKMDHYLTYLK